MPSFGDNCSPNCSPLGIVKINYGGGLLIHSDPVRTDRFSFVFLALDAPELHQNTSFAAQRLLSAYQEFERFGGGFQDRSRTHRRLALGGL
jgi:hypothetical protein